MRHRVSVESVAGGGVGVDRGSLWRPGWRGLAWRAEGCLCHTVPDLGIGVSLIYRGHEKEAVRGSWNEPQLR